MSSRLKDPVSGLTHFIGAILALAGLGLLVWKTTHPFRPWHLTSCAVFGTGMIMLYTVSTLYHWLILPGRGTEMMRKLDHIMIFVLIASTYTPFCLVPFRGTLGWSLFAGVWSIAVLGTVFKLFWIDAPRFLSTIIYVAMGWIAVFGAGTFVRVLEPGALFWLVSGGVFYSVGALIYAVKKPDIFPGWLGFHEVFHIFVLLGSSAHFWVIYRYITAYD
ncbi:MAG TPA: hemolysin III family protein [Deltaproteobacteria bacterium]|nr:hemolysin III family protein [Deltaproteobacteria bacterium]HOI07532.1 hemolysin III family protein [Deltaproteobacteria bacterium]